MEDKYIEKKCKKHGITRYALEGRGYYRCMKCRVENVLRRRHRLKKKAIEYLGGKCKKCGYAKCVNALEFHHRDPSEKEFTIARKRQNYGWDRIKHELDKCDLLCSNCHKEEHYKNNTDPV